MNKEDLLLTLKAHYFEPINLEDDELNYLIDLVEKDING